jgi:hypothetical protein
MSGSFHVNLSFSLNDPILFLHVCDYLPFEEMLALYLNKLEFPLGIDDLYQVSALHQRAFLFI